MTEKGFVAGQVKALTKELKLFPSDFIKDYESKEVSVPEKHLIMGEEFFGQYEILNADGGLVLHVPSYDEAKFIVFASRLKPAKIFVPVKSEDLKRSLVLYGKYLDSVIKDITALYTKSFPEGKNLHSIINEIFRILNIVRY